MAIEVIKLVDKQLDASSLYMQSVFDKIYPVGSIYMSVNSTSPATLFGGTWEQMKDRFLVGAGNDYGVNSLGGSAWHQLTVSELPKHSHKVFIFTGNSDNSGAYTAGYLDDYGNRYDAGDGAKITHGWNSSSFKTWGATYGDGTGDPAGNTKPVGDGQAFCTTPLLGCVYVETYRIRRGGGICNG